MGRERNLIIDKRQTNLIPTTDIKGEVNKEGVRKMTPREWALLQGFPQSFAFHDTFLEREQYKQAGNTVYIGIVNNIVKNFVDILGV